MNEILTLFNNEIFIYFLVIVFVNVTAGVVLAIKDKNKKFSFDYLSNFISKAVVFLAFGFVLELLSQAFESAPSFLTSVIEGIKYSAWFIMYAYYIKQIIEKLGQLGLIKSRIFTSQIDEALENIVEETVGCEIDVELEEEQESSDNEEEN